MGCMVLMAEGKGLRLTTGRSFKLRLRSDMLSFLITFDWLVQVTWLGLMSRVGNSIPLIEGTASCMFRSLMGKGSEW